MTTTRRHARLIALLDGSEHDPAEVGEAAALLDRVVGAGYPMPPTVVITAASYESVVEQNSMSLLIDDLRTSALPDPQHTQAEAAAIERAFLKVQLPDRLQRAIQRIAKELLPSQSFSVRPSVVNEDLERRTEPGHYLTIPAITESNNLETAVRRCWASLWMPPARRHRRNQHMADHHIAMAVIVQQNPVVETCGRAFSVDPGGQYHLARVETGASTYRIRKDTLEIIGVTGDPPPFLEDLGRIIVRLEKTLGGPHQTKWSYGSAGLTLLDVVAMPEPGVRSNFDDGFDSGEDGSDTFTPHGITEMLPGVVPPLLWTINAPMLENAFRSAFASLGGETPRPDDQIVTRVRGRAALNLSRICAVAESLPGGNPAEVERQYIGRSLSPEVASGSSGVHLFAALRSRRVHREIADDVELIDTAARTIAGLGIEVAHLPVRRLVAYRQRIRDLAWRGYAAEVGASSAAGATYRALELLLERWLPETAAAEWAQRLTRTAINRSTLGGLRAGNLTALLRDCATPEIRTVLSTQSRDPAVAIAALGATGRGFMHKLEEVTHSMGSRAVYGDVTWAEDDDWIWRQLRLLNNAPPPSIPSDPEEDLGNLLRVLTADRKWRRLRILTGQLVDLRSRWLRRQVAETTLFLELREKAKNALLILGGEERRIIVEAAKRLVASGQLPSLDLVEYLTDFELDGMLFGSCSVERSLLEHRRTVGRRCREAAPLPDWFVGDPATRERGVAEEKQLRGRGTSPGRTEGIARVITSLDDGVRLQPGDVLVAHSTDPSWTPLFLAAGAVVLETGGPLSHASIVAREYGLPAVLSIEHATQIIIDGEPISVDGTSGTVERIGSAA